MNARPKSRLSRIHLLIPAFILLLLGAVSVVSLPNLSVEHGESCKRCHFSPSGGGMRNEYGNFTTALNELCIPPTREIAAKQYKSPRIAPGLTVGFDTRHLFLGRNYSFFRMQTDFYATVEPMSNLFYSVRFTENGIRENYAMMEFGDQKFSLRAGRFSPAFGLRNEDHTSYNRERTGNGSNTFLDGVAGSAELFGADLMVEGFDQFGRGVYGVHVMRSGYVAPFGYLIGGSARFTEKVDDSYGTFPWAQSVFGGLSFDRVTTMGEVDFVGRHSDTLVFYGNLTVRPVWGVYLIGEYSFMDPNRRYETGIDEFVRASINCYPISFVMISPSYTFYTHGPFVGSNDWYIQFHVGY
jgi:hypothetical protein